AMIGDGSAMYTCQGLWTAARESLAIVYVIFNNASYRILKQRTLALKGFSAEDDFYVGMDLDKPFVDYVGLSRSLGVPGERVEKAAEVGPAIGRGLACCASTLPARGPRSAVPWTTTSPRRPTWPARREPSSSRTTSRSRPTAPGSCASTSRASRRSAGSPSTGRRAASTPRPCSGCGACRAASGASYGCR